MTDEGMIAADTFEGWLPWSPGAGKGSRSEHPRESLALNPIDGGRPPLDLSRILNLMNSWQKEKDVIRLRMILPILMNVFF